MGLIPELPFDISIMPVMGMIAKWVFYFILSGSILGGVWIFYYISTFNIKVRYWPLFGSSKDGVFSIGKMKTNRAQWNKTKNAWKYMFPLFNKKEHPPFDSEYIYPGGTCYAFRINQSYIPGRLNADVVPVAYENEEEFVSHVQDLAGLYDISLDNFQEYFPMKIGGALSENAMRASLDPVEYHLDKWLQAYSKETINEFRAEDWWDQNKQLFITLGVAIVCCIMVGICAYFVYKMISEGRPEAAAMTNALNNFADSLAGSRGVTPN